MWGQARSRPRHPRRLGIIPTRVGTRGDMLSISPRWNNHPHACGDKRANREKCKYKLGSSPRVWGQESVKCVDDDSTRIIPTRVGTSVYKHGAGRVFSGSSPRVWGQVLTYTSVYVYCRIIPTRVGTSF